MILWITKGEISMEKFVPFEKLSKKKQRELNAMKRRDWNGINPVTRKSENPKAYNRRKAQKRADFDSVPFLFYMPYLSMSVFKKSTELFIPCFLFCQVLIISGRSGLLQNLSYMQLCPHQWVSVRRCSVPYNRSGKSFQEWCKL